MTFGAVSRIRPFARLTISLVAAMGIGALSVPALAATSAPVTPTPVVAASPSSAIGVVTVQPGKGTDQMVLSLAMSTMCPSGGTNVIGTLFGPGLPAIGLNVVPNSTTSLYPHTVGGGLYLSSNNTLRNLVNELPDPPNLKGTYRVRVECRGPAKIADLGDFYGSVVFDGHHGYVAKQDIPTASLVTIAAPSGPPIPTAVGSEAPQTSGSAPPTIVHGSPIVATSPVKRSQSSYGPWLIALGIVIVLGGILTLTRGRRTGKPGTAAK